MKPLLSLFFLLFMTPLIAADTPWSFEAQIGLNADFFENTRSAKNPDAYTATQLVKLSYEKADWHIFTKLYAQEAYYDTQVSSQQTDRTYVRLDELYARYERADYKFLFGRSIRFWGALELYNLVDRFNARDLRNKMNKVEKIGAWNMEYSYFTETGSINLIVKFYEESEPMAASPYLFYFLPNFVSYNSTPQTEKKPYIPTVYLKYNGTTDWEYPLDYAMILEHGYSGKRYFYTATPQNLVPSLPSYGSPTEFQERVYLVDQIDTYDTMVVDAMLLKLEASYSRVKDDPNVGDSLALGTGFEYTINGIFQTDADLGLLSEYYRYWSLDDTKYDDLRLFEVYQNDLFLAIRCTLNDLDRSTLLAGVVADMQYDEYTVSAKYETHFKNAKLSLSYSRIEPSATTQTAYAYIGRTQSLSFEYVYYF